LKDHRCPTSGGFIARCGAIHLSQYAGQPIQAAWINADINTGAGDWQEYFADIALYRQDGTVIPVYHRQMGVSYSYAGTSGVSNPSFNIDRSISMGDAMYAVANTTYYAGDQLGSGRMLLAGTGWPVSSSTFYPFGLEQSATTDPNHYKFAGLERDEQNGEPGLDHATFRQYSSTMGRWYAPDPYLGSMDLNDPQSFNRYSYVGNNPLSYIDPSGLRQCNGTPADTDGPCTVGGGGGGGLIGIIQTVLNVIGLWHKPPFKGVAGDPRRCIANCGKPAPPDDPAPNKKFDPNDPSYQLAVALGKKGAYTVVSPCFVPAFYLASAVAASPVAATAAVDSSAAFLEAASEDVVGTVQKIVDWANKAPTRASTRAPAIGGTIKTTKALAQYCNSH
ncbi:MAG: RHS repeat-associated core domain-containing protein, partial [Acidobacteria bacterium]|nr:RHS repeat-associated core domain-containing protein [Acidobacteriota bacterium]